MFSTKRFTYLALIIIFLVCQNLPAFSVQSIINIPSSEVLPQNSMIFKDSNNIMFDGPARITPSVIMGIGHGIELSTGVSTFVSGDSSIRGMVAAKKTFFVTDSVRLTVGGRLNPYLNQKSEPDSLVYSHLSHRIKKTKTALTAGFFAASRQDSIPSNAGVMLGLDQVIIPNKLRFAVDYMSGNEQYGLFSAGLKYRPVPTVSITSAVLISPSDCDRIALRFSVAKSITLKKQSKQKERV